VLHVRQKKGKGVAQRSLGFSLMRIKHRLPPEVGLTHIDAVLEYGELANHMWGDDFGEALSLTEALWLSSVLIALPGGFSPCRYVPQARQDS
jgi:hypothetical protein